MLAAARRQRSGGPRPAPALKLVAALGVAVCVLTACGSKHAGSPTSSAPPSSVALNGNGSEQRLTVHVGDRFTLEVPGGSDVSELGTKELRDEGGNTFKAIGVGTATIEVTRRPSCVGVSVSPRLDRSVPRTWKMSAKSAAKSKASGSSTSSTP